MSQDEDKEIAYQLSHGAKLSQLGKNYFNPLPIKIELDIEKQRQNEHNTSPLHPSSHTQLHPFILDGGLSQDHKKISAGAPRTLQVIVKIHQVGYWKGLPLSGSMKQFY